MSSDPKLFPISKSVVDMKLVLTELPHEAFLEIGINHPIYFSKSSFPFLEKNDLSTIRSVLERQCDLQNSFRASQRRHVQKELSSFNSTLNDLKKSMKVTTTSDFKFKIKDVEDENCRIDYAKVFSSTFETNLTNFDLQKLNSKKWERLKSVDLLLHEKSVIWRIWHNALINFKIANIMGLISDCRCPYCYIENCDCRHIIFCSSSESLWSHVWYIINQSGFKLDKPDRLFGVEKAGFINTLIYLCINILYKRFLYNINSGLSDYDLIKQYNVRLYELIYNSFSSAKKRKQIR